MQWAPLLLASGILCLPWTIGPAEGTDLVHSLLQGTDCGDATRRELDRLGADPGHAIAEPPDPIGTRSVRMPTHALGVWLRLTVGADDRIGVDRITAHHVETWNVGFDCALVPFPGGGRRADAPPQHAAAFDDQQLAARLARGDSGVILLWSPHMPLSVDQYAVLLDVTRAMGLALVALLDPGADALYAARVARERGLPASALAPLAGIELAFRGMTTHAPSAQAFARGRLVGPVLFGYRGTEAARLALETVASP